MEELVLNLLFSLVTFFYFLFITQIISRDSLTCLFLYKFPFFIIIIRDFNPSFCIILKIFNLFINYFISPLPLPFYLILVQILLNLESTFQTIFIMSFICIFLTSFTNSTPAQ